MLLTPVFWPGEFQGLYNLMGHKESDMTDFNFLVYHKHGLVPPLLSTKPIPQAVNPASL